MDDLFSSLPEIPPHTVRLQRDSVHGRFRIRVTIDGLPVTPWCQDGPGHEVAETRALWRELEQSPRKTHALWEAVKALAPGDGME